MSKLCECGCGQPTNPAPRTHSSKGIVKGEPQRFINGHQSRSPRPTVPPHPNEDARYIPLTRGRLATVDATDFDWLNQWAWLYHNGYAARSTPDGFVFMQNLIMPPPKGMEVDHRNLVKLDNRRTNLRHCTSSQNKANLPNRGVTSAYKGVSWVKRDSQWLAQIQVKNKSYRLGQFDNEIDAAKAYDEAARIHFGTFGRYNFPMEGEQHA